MTSPIELTTPVELTIEERDALLLRQQLTEIRLQASQFELNLLRDLIRSRRLTIPNN